MLTDSEQCDMHDISFIICNLGNWASHDPETRWLVDRWRELNRKQQTIVLGPLPGAEFVC